MFEGHWNWKELSRVVPLVDDVLHLPIKNEEWDWIELSSIISLSEVRKNPRSTLE